MGLMSVPAPDGRAWEVVAQRGATEKLRDTAPMLDKEAEMRLHEKRRSVGSEQFRKAKLN